MQKKEKIKIWAVNTNLGMQNRAYEWTKNEAGVAGGGEIMAKMIKDDLRLNDDQIQIKKEACWWQEENKNNKKVQWNKIADLYGELIAETEKECRDDEELIFLGGDHSLALPAVIAAQRQMEKQDKKSDLGVLMFDSHADLHQPSTSPSNNFHGMWLRVLTDTFEQADIDALISKKIEAKNIMLVGDKSYDFEPEEAEFIKQKEITTLTREDFKRDRIDFIKKINDFKKKFNYLHLTFDLDFINGQQVPVNIANENAFLIDEWLEIVNNLDTSGKVSMSIVELNPYQIKNEKQKMKNVTLAVEALCRRFYS